MLHTDKDHRLYTQGLPESRDVNYSELITNYCFQINTLTLTALVLIHK